MSEIKINGKTYKEKKIKALIVNGKPQSSMVLSSAQLIGQSKLHVNIETEPSRSDEKEDSDE